MFCVRRSKEYDINNDGMNNCQYVVCNDNLNNNSTLFYFVCNYLLQGIGLSSRKMINMAKKRGFTIINFKQRFFGSSYIILFDDKGLLEEFVTDCNAYLILNDIKGD